MKKYIYTLLVSQKIMFTYQIFQNQYWHFNWWAFHICFYWAIMLNWIITWFLIKTQLFIFELYFNLGLNIIKKGFNLTIGLIVYRMYG